MKTKSLLKLAGILVGLLLLASACGDSSESSSSSEADPATLTSDAPGGESEGGDEDAPGEDEDEADDDDGGSSGSAGSSGNNSEFCTTARQLASVNPFGDITSFDGSTFASINDFLTQAIDDAPADIRSDVVLLRDGFSEFGALLEKYDFNFFDAEFLSELESFSLDGLDEAGDSVSSYMRDECGIELDGDETDDSLGDGTFTDPVTASSLAETFEGLEGDEAAVQALVQFLGIDQELAECLNEELGEFDTSSPDPSLLTREVCGTTLFEVITNIGSGG